MLFFSTTFVQKLSRRPLVGCEPCRHFIWYRRFVFWWCSSGLILIPVLFLLLIINDLLSTWKNTNALFADNATWHAILGPQFWLIFSVNHCMTGWCIWLVQLIRSTTRPVLGSDASSKWNFCARSSDVISGKTSGGVKKFRLFLHARISLFSPYFGLNGKRSSLLIIFWHKRIYFWNLSAYQQQGQQHFEHQFSYIYIYIFSFRRLEKRQYHWKWSWNTRNCRQRWVSHSIYFKEMDEQIIILKKF